MEKKKIVALCATMDTKAEEARLLQKELESYGIEGKLIDLSLRGESPPDVFLSAQDLAGDQFPRMQQTVSRLEASRVYGARAFLCAAYPAGERHA